MEEQEQLKQTVANNIAQLRKSKGLTQLELAERLNYSDKAVSKWERGEGLPDVLVLSKMAEIFDVTLAELVDGKTKKPRQQKARAHRCRGIAACVGGCHNRFCGAPSAAGAARQSLACVYLRAARNNDSAHGFQRSVENAAVCILRGVFAHMDNVPDAFRQHNFRYRQRLAAVHNRHSPANTQHSVVLPFKKIKNPSRLRRVF